MSEALSQMTVLILVACMGFVSAKVGYIDADMRAKLSKILVNITLPCMIVISANDLDAEAVQSQIPLAFALAAGQFFLLLVCGALCNALLRTPTAQRPLYLFMATCTNSAFIGLPIVSSLYGGQTVLFASIFVMVLAFFMYSVGFGILAKDKPESAGGGDTARIRRIVEAFRRLPWRSIANPSMLSCALAIAMLLTGVRVPAVLENAMSLLGSVTSPVAMMLVGAIVADADVRAVVKEPRMYPFILIRQLAAPLACAFALGALGVDAALIVVFVIMLAMPTGTMASAFAEQFGHDGLLAAKGTILSTAASFAIVPLLVSVMPAI